MLTHILAALLAIAVWSCGGKHNDRLERADALVCADPAAALCALDSIDAEVLSEADLAWYGLLRAKAADKSYRHLDNDSLIGFATDYFAGCGDSLEIQALYYQGYGLSRNNQLEEALVTLSEAYEKAEDTDEYFYAGMSAREMAAVCVRLMMTREQLKYARLAKRMFEMAGKPEHSMWMDETILSSLILNKEYDEASQLVSYIEADTAINDPDFRLEIEDDKALLSFDLERYREAKDILTALQRNGYPLTANNMYRIADAALRLGESDSAEYYFEEAADLSHAREDSLYRMVMGARLAAQIGDYHKAYGISQELVKCVMLGDESLLTSPGNDRLLDDLRIKHEKSKAEARYHHVIIIALGAGSMLLMLLIGTLYLYMRMRLKAKRLEVEMFMHDAARLRDELSMSEDKQKSASLRTETMIENQAKLSERIRGDLKELFSRHTALLNTLCQAYYVSRGAGSDNDDLSKGVKRVLQQIRDIEVVERQKSIIDNHDNNWMTRFMYAYPSLTERQYLLVMYIYMGFSPEAITVLLGKENPQYFYMLKNRLKKKMLRISGGLMDEFLIRLNMNPSTN